MDDNSFQIVAKLDISKSADLIKGDIQTLENKLKSDSNARLKILAGLDIAKSKNLIQSQLTTIANQAKAPTIKVGVEVGNGKNSTKSILDSKAFADIEAYLNEMSKRISQVQIVDPTTFAQNIKKSIGASTPAVKNAVNELVQALKLTPNNQQAIFDSYSYLIEAIRGTIDSSKIVNDKNFEKNLADEIYRAATSFKEVQVQAQQASNVVNNSMQQMQSQAQQTANAVNSIGNSVNSSILDSFRKSLANIGMSSTDIDNVANRINNLGVQITSLNQSVSNTKKGQILSVEISGTDKLGQAVTLTQKYNLETQETIRNVEAVATASNNASSKLESLAAQQTKQIANYKNQINQIDKAARDPNASRSITSQAHLDELTAKYNDITAAISKMGSKSKAEFAQQEADVSKLISDYKALVSEYKNAENVSTTLKPDKLASAISKAQSQFATLETRIKNSNVSSEKLTENVNKIKGTLNGDINLINKSQIEEVFTALSNARSELQALIEAKTSNSSVEKLSSQARTLKNELNTFANKNAGFSTWQHEINGTVVSMDTLITELNNVKTQADFTVVKAHIREFQSAFANSTVDVKTFGNEISSAISKLQSLQGSNIFRNNASNTEVVKIKAEITDIIAKYQELQTRFQSNPTPEGLKQLEADLTTLNSRFATATDSATSLQRSLAETNGVDKLRQKTDVLIARIEAYKKANSNAIKAFGGQFESMLSQLRSGNLDNAGVDRISKQFQILRQEINATGKAGKTFFQSMIADITKFAKWMSMTYFISTFTRSIRSMITSVVDLDTALVDLKKTFTGTETDLKNFYISANQTAKDLGVTTKEIINQASAWSRLGLLK